MVRIEILSPLAIRRQAVTGTSNRGFIINSKPYAKRVADKETIQLVVNAYSRDEQSRQIIAMTCQLPSSIRMEPIQRIFQRGRRIGSVNQEESIFSTETMTLFAKEYWETVYLRTLVHLLISGIQKETGRPVVATIHINQPRPDL